MKKPGRKTLEKVYSALYSHFGTQNWWPAETPFEVAVGAILTQNAAWANVEKAIANLKKARKLTPDAIVRTTPRRLAGLVRPAGYFNVKARRLANFARHVSENYDGSVERMKSRPAAELRAELLAINGIGEETADSIMLYALGFPEFVVDAYTKRVLCRHGWAGPKARYGEIKAMFERLLARDPRKYNEFHALFVAVGKRFCRPKRRCAGCPLEGFQVFGEDAVSKKKGTV